MAQDRGQLEENTTVEIERKDTSTTSFFIWPQYCGVFCQNIFDPLLWQVFLHLSTIKFSKILTECFLVTSYPSILIQLPSKTTVPVSSQSTLPKILSTGCTHQWFFVCYASALLWLKKYAQWVFMCALILEWSKSTPSTYSNNYYSFTSSMYTQRPNFLSQLGHFSPWSSFAHHEQVNTISLPMNL
jgi:hypothetical protein